MVDPITVKELSELLNKAVAAGYGDDYVKVSDDEEVNGYHFLYSRNWGTDGNNSKIFLLD